MSKTPSKSGPEQEPKGGLEAAKTPELSSFLHSLSKLRSVIQGNEPIVVNDVRNIGTSAAGVRINAGDVTYSLEEAKDNPNITIWGEILSGNFDRMTELTELPAFIVKNAPVQPFSAYNHTKCRCWDCPNLKVLLLDTAAALSRRQDEISLTLNTEISRATAEELAKNNTLERSWFKYTSIFEATRLTPEWTHALFAGVENRASEPFYLRVLDFRSMTASLTPDIVKEMYWIPKGKNKHGKPFGEGWDTVSLPVMEYLDLATAKAMAKNPRLPVMQLGTNTRFENSEVADIFLNQEKVKTLARRVVYGGHLQYGEKRKEHDELTFDSETVPAWHLAYHLKKTPLTEEIIFTSLESIDDDLLDALSTYHHKITFHCLTDIDPRHLQRLADMDLTELCIGSHGGFDIKSFTILSKFKGKISLSPLRTIDLATVEVIKHMNFSGQIGLYRLQNLSPEVITALARIWHRIDVGTQEVSSLVFNEYKRLSPKKPQKTP